MLRSKRHRRTIVGEVASIVDMLPDLVFVTDAEGRNIATNKSFQRYAGCGPAVLLDDGWLGVLHPDDRGRAAETWAAALAAAEPYEAEYRFRAADGEHRWHLCRAAPHRVNGHIRRWIGVCSDIDDRKRREALTEQEAKQARAEAEIVQASADEVHAAVDGLRDAAIFMLDANGLIRSWSAAAERIKGFTAIETVDRFYDILFAPEDIASGKPRQQLDAALRDGVFACEDWRIRRDGSRFRADVTLTALRDAEGRTRGFAKVTRDITREHEARQAANEAGTAAKLSAEAFTRIIDDNPFGIYLVDADFRIAKVSRGARPIFGAVEPVGRDFAEVIAELWPRALADEVIARFRRTLATGEPYAQGDLVEQRADSGRTEAYDWRIDRVVLADGRHGVICYFYDYSERNALEAKAQAAEERYRLALAATGEAFWDWDVASDRVVRSDAFATHFGHPAERMRMERDWWSSRIHPADRERVIAALQAAITSGYYEAEYRFQRGDGCYAEVIDRGRTIRDAEGRAIRIVGALADVTARKQSEREQTFHLTLNERLRDLAEPQAMMDAATELLGRHLRAAQVGFAEVEADQAHIVVRRDWNDGCVPSVVGRWRMDDFGPAFIREMKAGRTVAIADVRSDPRTAGPAVLEAYAGIGVRAILDLALVRGGRLMAMMFVHHHEPRTWSEREIALVEETCNRLWSAVERARAEAALKASEAKLRRIAESNMIGVGFGEDDGRITYANDALLAMIGRNRAELEAGVVDWAALTAPEHRERDALAATQIRLSGACAPYEKDYIRPDGTRLPVQVAAASFDPEGRSSEHVALVADLSQRNAAQAALERAKAELEQRVSERTASLHRANARLRDEIAHRETAQAALAQSQKLEALGQLTSGIAHDFNNVIAAISGGFHVIRRRTDDPRITEVAQHGVKAAERGATIVRQLLSFARQEALAPATVDLAALLRDSQPLLQQAAGPKLRVTIQCPTDLKPVRVDPAQLETALINLAVNARDAMPEGGALTVSVAESPQDEPERPPELGRHDAARIIVRDDGPGMPPDVLQRVVEPFFTTKGPGKGTGLGLAMVHGFARQSGGALRIESRVGTGTSISIYLPCSEDLLEPITAEEPAIDPALHGRARLLLVDDDDAVRGVTAADLRDLGYDVVEAGSYAAALPHMVEGGGIDAVVTDVVMPGRDGVELAAILRRANPALPILFLTGHADRGRLGDETVLAKPFRPDELSRAVLKLLGRSTDADAAERAAALTRLAARLRSDCLKSMLMDWREASEANPIPPIEAFDPTRCAEPGKIVVAAADAGHVPIRFRFLSVGGDLERMLGRPLTDAAMAVTGDDWPTSWEAAYRRCVKTRRPCYDYVRMDLGDDRPEMLERLLLPFSTDGRLVDRLVACVIIKGRDAAAGATPQMRETHDA